MRRNAVLFVTISLLSGFGSTAMALVAGIWILDLTGSVSLAGLAGLCVYAPTLAAPWLGALVDRLPRRRLAIAVDLVLAAALLTLLGVRSGPGAWLIFAVMLVYGISYVLIDAAETALLPAALPPAALADVNGWRSSAQEGMKLVAPLVGAGLYAWHGGAAVAVLSAAMPVLVALLYTRIRLTAPVGPVPGGHRGDGTGAAAPGARAALAVLRRVRAIRVPVLVAAVAIGLSGFTVASLYARVTGGLGLPSAFLGVLASAQGAGSIAGGLAVGRLVTRVGTTPVAAAGALVFAAGCVAWCLPWWPAMIAGSVAAGVGLPWVLVAAVTAIQEGTPDHLLGRVAATANTAMFGPIALTNPLGAVAVHGGPRGVLLTAAAAAAAVALWAHTAKPGPQREAGPELAAGAGAAVGGRRSD